MLGRYAGVLGVEASALEYRETERATRASATLEPRSVDLGLAGRAVGRPDDLVELLERASECL